MGGVGVGMGWGLRVGGPCNSVRRVPITFSNFTVKGLCFVKEEGLGSLVQS